MGPTGLIFSLSADRRHEMSSSSFSLPRDFGFPAVMKYQYQHQPLPLSAGWGFSLEHLTSTSQAWSEKWGVLGILLLHPQTTGLRPASHLRSQQTSLSASSWGLESRPTLGLL